MDEKNKNKKRYFLFGVAALLFAIIAISIAQEAQDTANINNVLEIVVNNTNLAPTFAGEPPGTGERFGNNTTYWANSSAIELFVFGHAQVQNNALHLSLYINGTQTEHTELRPLGAAERTHAYVTAIIPKGANYSVNITNYHHYEWREYPILAGKNGTLSINQTVVNNFTNISGGGGASNLSQLTIDINKDWMGYSISNVSLNESSVINLTSDLNSKVNKSGDTINGTIYFNFSGIPGTDLRKSDEMWYNNSTNNVQRSYKYWKYGIEEWFLNDAVVDRGWITYTTPLGSAGLALYNESRLNRSDIRNHPRGLELTVQTGSVAQQNGDLTMYRNNKTVDISANFSIRTPGAGITMYSPNGNAFCTTVTNLGALTTVAGACI